MMMMVMLGRNACAALSFAIDILSINMEDCSISACCMTVALMTGGVLSIDGGVMSSFCHWEGDILVLNVLGRPSARRTAIGKVIGRQLEIHVAEAPVRGRATAHLVRFLAEQFQVDVSAIVVVFGVYKVNKQLRVAAPKRLPAVIPPPYRQGSQPRR
jgi:uncharacterized protein YggU (UPF0235/DUF167 family)